MGNEKDIVFVLDAFLDSRLRNVHTMIPGKIEKYYGHDERKARVKPLVKLRTVKGDELIIPPIDNVPVIFPSSSKFSLLYPLNKDDGCMIQFSEEGIGAFLNGTVEVTADSFARFALTDAVCIPGLWSFKNVPDSDSTIEIDNDGNIILNDGALKVARDTDPTANVFSVGSNPTWHTWFLALHALVPGYPGAAGTGTITGTITDGASTVKS